MIKLNFLLGLGYFFAGLIGNLIAIPVNYASPIWPAAGIALAGLLVYGRAVLPGIWVGAFLTQTYAFLDSSTQVGMMQSLVNGAIISLGAVLQAVSGEFLVKRYTYKDPYLIKESSILQFLCYAGPVSCLVSSSIGISTLYWQGVLSLEDYALGWLTWWSGDVIGSILFTVLFLCFFGKPRDLWQTRIYSVALPLLLLLLVITGVFFVAKNQEERRIATLFEERVNLQHNALLNELGRTVDIGQTMKAFFDSGKPVDQPAFQTFTRSLMTVHKNIQAIEWIPRISQQERESFERQSGQGFSIRVLGEQSGTVIAPIKNEYFPIVYIEPAKGNERAFGFDVSSNPIANEAIEIARQQAVAAVTRNIRLVQGGDQPSVVIYTPVFSQVPMSNKNEESKPALTGLIAVVLIVGNKIEEVRAQFEHLQLTFDITDDETVLYQGGEAYKPLDRQILHLNKALLVEFAGREWQVTYRATPQFFSSVMSWSVWWLILGCLILACLIGSGLLMLTGRALQTENIVKLRTAELEDEIAERKRMLARRNDQNLLLQAIVDETPLTDVLTMIVKMSEQLFPGSLSSILLLDEKKERLHLGAAPNLPSFYNEVIDGFVIGDGVGSCGTAAYLGERVIVESIKNHAFWHDYQEIAEQADLASCWSEPVFSSKKEVIGIFAIYHRHPYRPTQEALDDIENITQLASIAIEKKQAEQQIARLAFFDALTGLPNRRLFMDRLEQSITKVINNRHSSALLYLDLDHFKTLNDALGHDTGDELLIQVANRLKTCVRDEDTVARLGGDEFVLLLGGQEDSNSLFDHALTIAERVQVALLAPYHLKGYIHHISSSIGITLLDKNLPTEKTITTAELLKQADTAMYHAKQRGRNTISFYNLDMQQRADQRLLLEHDLRSAAIKNQLCLYYQPQIDEAGQLIGAEALLRWQHPEKGMVAPGDFIPVAEETGLIFLLGEWVLEEACRQLQKWPRLVHLAVNVSPKEFHQAKFTAHIKLLLDRYRIAPHRLMLEITESIIIDNIDDSVAKLKILQELGVKISIDDFGTGYSSLTYLKLLPLSQLKIDQSFVRDITTDPSDAVIVEAIISMAKYFGLSVIAEGVETAEQLQFLTERHCEGYQGYYFSRPLVSDDFSSRYGEQLF